MIRKFIYYLILTAVVFSCVTVQVPAFADEATEDYTDITHSLSKSREILLVIIFVGSARVIQQILRERTAAKLYWILVIGLKRCLR